MVLTHSKIVEKIVNDFVRPENLMVIKKVLRSGISVKKLHRRWKSVEGPH